MWILAIGAMIVLLVGCSGPSSAPPAPKPAQPAPAQTDARPTAQPALEAPKPAAPVQPSPAAPKPAADKPAGLSVTQLVAGAPAQTSSYYVYTTSVAKLLQAKLPGVNVTVSEAGGTVDNLKRLVEGKTHFSLGAFAGLYPIYAGLDPNFKDKPQKEIRTLWAIDPVAEVWFVREDSSVTNVEQLQGKDFAGGGRGSASDQLARLFAFPALGIEPKWYVGGTEDVLAAMKDRRIVGMGKASALRNPDAVILDAMTSMRIRILGWTPEQVAKVKAKHDWMNTTQVPAGVYKADWNQGPITTWQNGACIFSVSTVPEDVAYTLTKAAVEDIKQADSIQAGAFPAMKGADLVALTMQLSSVPLHAGSYRYFKEIGAPIPDRLKPPEAQ
ncbi:MAG: TAXI family TRAP transporter solute-binding subunit [Chloroflexi bacterium]|nr:TAXI family TRAP transporter solute-binding subunit [Chloroflexota bacterium]